MSCSPTGRGRGGAAPSPLPARRCPPAPDVWPSGPLRWRGGPPPPSHRRARQPLAAAGPSDQPCRYFPPPHTLCTHHAPTANSKDPPTHQKLAHTVSPGTHKATQTAAPVHRVRPERRVPYCTTTHTTRILTHLQAIPRFSLYVETLTCACSARALRSVTAHLFHLVLHGVRCGHMHAVGL